MSIALVTHSFTHGSQDAIICFLRRRKIPELLVITHPLPDFGKDLCSKAKLYRRGDFAGEIRFPLSICSETLSFVKDLFATFFLFLMCGRRYVVYIGADSLNAAAGLILRRLGLVDVVIYYAHSYRWSRFGNPIKNLFYHMLESLCVRSCDFVWSLSRRLTQMRRSQGVSDERNVWVPESINFRRTQRLPFDSVAWRRLVFLGLLAPLNGPELTIKAMPEVLEVVPETRLTIIGGGPLEDELKQMVTEKGLEKSVNFLGYTPYDKAMRMMSKFGVGLAPYAPLPDSTMWTSDPSKTKDYMACGLPVIVTTMVEPAAEIRENRAGLAINYDSRELAEAIIKLLTDREYYCECKNNAINLASKYDIDLVVGNAWRETLQRAMNNLSSGDLRRKQELHNISSRLLEKACSYRQQPYTILH